MNVKARFDHFNINVSNLEKSLEFYKKALSLHEAGEIKHPDGDFIIKYLKSDDSDFRLELTWLRDHPQAYELGENESHLALRVKDYESVKQYHREMDVICFENEKMGIYFINDPDDYWIEIIPERK